MDTSEISLVKFALVDPMGKNIPTSKTYKLDYGENWKTLTHLQSFLKSNDYRLSAIDSMLVCSGPGSPTGLRVGVALAQGLAFGLGIPIKVIKKDSIPKNLRLLASTNSGKDISITYSRPAL